MWSCATDLRVKPSAETACKAYLQIRWFAKRFASGGGAGVQSGKCWGGGGGAGDLQLRDVAVLKEWKNAARCRWWKVETLQKTI